MYVCMSNRNTVAVLNPKVVQIYGAILRSILLHLIVCNAAHVISLQLITQASSISDGYITVSITDFIDVNKLINTNI